ADRERRCRHWRHIGRSVSRGIVNSALSSEEMKTFKNFIDGEWVEPTTGEYFANVNPADSSDEIGRFPLSGVEDVNRAVAAARRGFTKWRATPAPARGDVLRRVGDL